MIKIIIRRKLHHLFLPRAYLSFKKIVVMKKKIIAAFESDRFSPATLDYAIDLAKQSESLVVGVFLRAIPQLGVGAMSGTGAEWGEALAFQEWIKTEEEKLRVNKSLFHSICANTGVQHKVLHESFSPVEQLIHLSAFADIIILDTQASYTGFRTESPSPSLRDILADAHCPVIVVPSTFSPVRSICLTYDASPASVFAIKMLHYLFPEWKSLPVSLVSVLKDSSNHLPEHANIHDFMKRIFPQATPVILHGPVEDALLSYCKQLDEHTLLCMGAYSRSAMSRVFRESTANRIMEEIRLPLFITHR
jgi:hypothetical protein